MKKKKKKKKTLSPSSSSPGSKDMNYNLPAHRQAAVAAVGSGGRESKTNAV